MILFETESGGAYLLDDEAKRFQRLEGPEHLGRHPDGAWHEFEQRAPLVVGAPAVFAYEHPAGGLRFTTPVTHYREVDDDGA